MEEVIRVDQLTFHEVMPTDFRGTDAPAVVFTIGGVKELTREGEGKCAIMLNVNKPATEKWIGSTIAGADKVLPWGEGETPSIRAYLSDDPLYIGLVLTVKRSITSLGEQKASLAYWAPQPSALRKGSVLLSIRQLLNSRNIHAKKREETIQRLGVENFTLVPPPCATNEILRVIGQMLLVPLPEDLFELRTLELK